MAKQKKIYIVNEFACKQQAQTPLLHSVIVLYFLKIPMASGFIPRDNMSPVCVHYGSLHGA